MRITTDDAVQWLLRHKKRSERGLLCATVDQVDDVLLDTTLVAWPDPEFNRIYRRIDKAIDDVTLEYEGRKGLRENVPTRDGDDMREFIHRCLHHKSKNPITGSLIVSIGFVPEGDPFEWNPEAPMTSYLFEVVYEKQKVTANLARQVEMDPDSERSSAAQQDRPPE